MLSSYQGSWKGLRNFILSFVFLWFWFFIMPCQVALLDVGKPRWARTNPWQWVCEWWVCPGLGGFRFRHAWTCIQAKFTSFIRMWMFRAVVMACAGMSHLGSLGEVLEMSQSPLSLIMLLSCIISCIFYHYKRIKCISITQSII